MMEAPRAPSRVTLGLLTVLGLINLARGAVHVFLPDSGAGVIAHFDLTQGGGHFLQEDRPAEIAALIDSFISETR